MLEVDGQLISAADFRSASAMFPTGVTVVTRHLADGRPYGMTVSSFTSVSLEPPMILVCIDKRAGFLSGLSPEAAFAVNVLREDQQFIATRFSRPPESERFEGLDWADDEDGAPVLRGVVAAFICSLQQSVEAGDHYVLIAKVREIIRQPGLPLVWCGSSYHCLPSTGLPG